MFEIPALIPIRSPFRSLCTQWPSFGMYIFLGYTVVGVTLRLLACALAGDSGLLSLHHCAFISPWTVILNPKVAQTNKNSKISIEKVFKDGQK